MIPDVLHIKKKIGLVGALVAQNVYCYRTTMMQVDLVTWHIIQPGLKKSLFLRHLESFWFFV